MTLKQILKSVTPPVIWRLLKYARRKATRSVDCLTYAPHGWATKLPKSTGNEDAWAQYFPYALEDDRRECESAIRRFRDGQPLLIEQNNSADAAQYVVNMPCVYVLALTARLGPALRILDYGGNLATLYWIGKTLLPGVELEYHCRELASVAEEGRKISPEVIWHTDDDCFAERYDVVMFTSVLQYIQNWQDLLRRAAPAVGTYLFLSHVPTVEHVPSYVAMQRAKGMTLLHQQLNRADVLAIVQSTGLRLVREFVMREHEPIENAPEQPSHRGWLFERYAGD